jgi:hypothetical protein
MENTAVTWLLLADLSTGARLNRSLDSPNYILVPCEACFVVHLVRRVQWISFNLSNAILILLHTSGNRGAGPGSKNKQYLFCKKWIQ